MNVFMIKKGNMPPATYPAGHRTGNADEELQANPIGHESGMMTPDKGANGHQRQ